MRGRYLRDNIDLFDAETRLAPVAIGVARSRVPPEPDRPPFPLFLQL
jgi:hypothetical protein